MANTVYSLQVVPRLPAALGRLDDLAENLWFSWRPRVRELFAHLDPDLWLKVEANPKLFLRCLHPDILERAATSEAFLENYHQLLGEFDDYLANRAPIFRTEGLEDSDLIAYFSAEYGFHESFPIYSGGLGILAGDHCKTASDLNLRFVAIGLLYRQGYFRQRIDRHGQQIPDYPHTNPEDMPIRFARNSRGEKAIIGIPFPDRTVYACVWRAEVGRVPVLLLDTDIDENAASDRKITNVLYGGDQLLRLQQEAVLGIGGVRALRVVGIEPTVWHINEGHAAFLVLERIHELVQRGLAFDVAREVTAANTIFTTHTPVAAGHDVFPAEMVLDHFATYVSDFGMSPEQFQALGNGGAGGHEFNMTKLALHGSTSINGVSRIHGGVSAQIFQSAWPEVDVDENPVGYVTNGVHVPTFIRQTWSELLDEHLGADWHARLMDESSISRLMSIPDEQFWATNQLSKRQVLHALRARLIQQCTRNGLSEAHIHRLLRHVDPENPNVLTIGFARRFATYKRSTLLFSNLGWLESLVTSEERPILFVFAGKAHPADEPGQWLMREIQRISNQPPFIGKILLVEGYDIGMGRLLTSGVDVWLNTPIHPFEASGTSGMKAAINGTVNLSVLDGWWAEAYDGANGWGIPPSAEDHGSGERDRQDAQTLYEILQDEVVPLYYDQDESLGYSPGWVQICKRAMASALPRFNSQRVVSDYARHFYAPAAKRRRVVAVEGFGLAHELAAWKQTVRKAWPGVALSDANPRALRTEFGAPVALEVEVELNGLRPEDLRVECVLSRQLCSAIDEPKTGFASTRSAGEGVTRVADETAFIALFAPIGPGSNKHRYRLELQPPWAGAMSYSIRAVPYHKGLAHPYEMGLMRWL